jgi:hypothetical protein
MVFHTAPRTSHRSEHQAFRLGAAQRNTDISIVFFLGKMPTQPIVVKNAAQWDVAPDTQVLRLQGESGDRRTNQQSANLVVHSPEPERHRAGFECLRDRAMEFRTTLTGRAKPHYAPIMREEFHNRMGHHDPL